MLRSESCHCLSGYRQLFGEWVIIPVVVCRCLAVSIDLFDPSLLNCPHRQIHVTSLPFLARGVNAAHPLCHRICPSQAQDGHRFDPLIS